MRTPARMLAVFPFLALVLSACSKNDAGVSPADVAALAPSLASIQPANATAGVALSAPIVLHFSSAMMSGMEMLVVLHEGTVTGPVVATSAMWSSDRTTLTMTPQSAMKRTITYVVHMSPSLQDTAGHMINMTPGTAMGGQAVNAGMMGGATSMMNGQWGPGMTGAGWQAANGTFGMMFTFTTG